MSHLEEVFYPVILFLEFLGLAWFFLHMVPAMAAGALLGWFNGRAVLSRLAGGRFDSGGRWTLAAMLWEMAALALSVFLGCLNGWLLLFDQKSKVWGGGLALGAYLLARVLSAGIRKIREK